MSLDYYFDDLAKHGISLTDGQKKWYTKKYEILGENMKKEYPSTPDEAFEVNTEGLYYASYVNAVRSTKRVCSIPYDRTLRVHTAWDLGFRDASSIVFFQIAGKEIHIVDFIEENCTSMADYIKMVKDKPYIYGTHLAPHDIKVTEYSFGITRLDTAAKLGINFTICPDVSLSNGIDAVRNLFPRFWFDSGDVVSKLLSYLENYTQRWDKSIGAWSGRPLHDDASHACDAMRYLSIGIDYCHDESQTVTQEQADNLWRTHARRI